jgi:hypothetical protein
VHSSVKTSSRSRTSAGLSSTIKIRNFFCKWENLECTGPSVRLLCLFYLADTGGSSLKKYLEFRSSTFSGSLAKQTPDFIKRSAT